MSLLGSLSFWKDVFTGKYKNLKPSYFYAVSFGLCFSSRLTSYIGKKEAPREALLLPLRYPRGIGGTSIARSERGKVQQGWI